MNFFVDGFKKMFSDISSLERKKIKRQIPNILTLSRILLLPFILLALLKNNVIVALILIAISEISDMLDGRHARKYKLVSKFGAYLDACCDKVFIFSLIICLFFMIDRNIELLGMILILEVIIMLVNSYYNIKGFDTKVSIFGKIKTTLLDICIIYFYIDYFLNLNNDFILILSIITMISQIITIGFYLKKYLGGSNEVRRRV